MQDIDSLVRQAAQLAGREREAFLQGACGGDEALRVEVLRRLETLATDETIPVERPGAENGGDREEETVPMGLSSKRRAPTFDQFDPFEAGEKAGNQFGFPEISNCIVTGALGAGGMGTVFRGRQPELDREVAIKLLKAELAIGDATFEERFRLEAKAMARLAHPNIVSIYDSGTTPEGECYFVMEFVEGTTLQELLKERDLEQGEVLRIFFEICRALENAHERGFAHRDIKPANVLISREGEVKVADFGLAKLLSPEETGYGMTQTGMVMGTPRYWAPEQSEPEAEVDHRADIYALGIVLYEMLCGETPPQPYVSPSEISGCDARFDAVTERTLAPDPEDRYQTVRELREDLETIAATRPLKTRILANVGAGLVAALAAGLLSMTPIVERLDYLIQDAWMRARPAVEVSEDLALVVVSNECLERVGRWPWDRRRHAELLDRLKQSDVKVVAFDILFAEPSDEPAIDQAMVAAGKRQGGTIYAASFLDGAPLADGLRQWSATKALLPLDDLISSAVALGHTSSNPDSDGKRRRAPILVDFEGRLVPNLGFATALAHLGVSGDRVIPSHDQLYIEREGGAAMRVPLDTRGEMRINYPKDFDGIDAFRYSDVLDPSNSAILSELTGRCVIVGYWGEGLLDIYPTPVSELTPGVMSHAAIANSVLTGQFLSEAGAGATIASLFFSVMLLAAAFLPWKTRWGWIVSVILVSLALGGGLALLSAANLLIRPMPLLLATVLAMTALLVVRNLFWRPEGGSP